MTSFTRRCGVCLVLAQLLGAGAARAQAGAPPAIPHPCNSMPQARQFDFWIGQWDVTPWQVAAPTPAQWRQVWIDDSGTVLDYTGEFRDSAMWFTGWNRDAQGNRVEQKLTFFAIAPDTVRQLFEASSDGGKTWKGTFDGRYVRRR